MCSALSPSYRALGEKRLHREGQGKRSTGFLVKADLGREIGGGHTIWWCFFVATMGDPPQWQALHNGRPSIYHCNCNRWSSRPVIDGYYFSSSSGSLSEALFTFLINGNICFVLFLYCFYALKWLFLKLQFLRPLSLSRNKMCCIFTRKECNQSLPLTKLNILCQDFWWLTDSCWKRK